MGRYYYYIFKKINITAISHLNFHFLATLKTVSMVNSYVNITILTQQVHRLKKCVVFGVVPIKITLHVLALFSSLYS